MKTDRVNGIGRRKAIAFMLGGVASAGLAQGAVAEVLTQSLIPLPRPDGFHLQSIPGAEQLVAQAGLSGDLSFAVARTATGEMLETRLPLKRLPPASVAKTVTALYALDTLGAGHRFVTRVMRTGPVINGVVQGDVILVGGGDPTLDTDALGKLAGQLRSAGIQGVAGRFLIDDTALPRIDEIDDGQTEYAGYNPTISGLNLNYNRVHFEWRRQGENYSLKMDARAKQFAPDVRIAHMRIAARDVPVFDHEPGKGRDEWTVAKAALGKGGARWLPVRLPALYAGEVFQAVAAQQGVRLPVAQRVETYDAAEEITRHESAPLQTIVRDMLKYSTNLTAEVLGLSASLKRGGPPRDLSGSARAMSQWAKQALGMRHISFVDHSGLGVASKVTTVDMVHMLNAPGIAQKLRPLLKHIPMRDGQGAVLKNHPVHVSAKTGTLTFVSSLAGYVTTPMGETVTFAIFAGDLEKRRAAKAAGDEVPRGARSFNKRAKQLQQALIERWASYYEMQS